jgi:hypothetical protein
MTDAVVKFRRVGDVVARRVAGELILVPFAVRSTDVTTRAAEFYVLNDSAELLWNALENAVSRADLARKLMNAFPIDSERASTDVDAFLQSMLEIGAIESAENRA